MELILTYSHYIASEYMKKTSGFDQVSFFMRCFLKYSALHLPASRGNLAFACYFLYSECMIIDYGKRTRKNLLKDLWIIFGIQVGALILAVVFWTCFVLEGIIPDCPQWDNTHLLCGALGIVFLVVFIITMLWGGCKIMDWNFFPRKFQLYAVGIWILPLFFYTVFSVFESELGSVGEKGFVAFFVIFPIFNLIFLLWACCWLQKN